MIFVDSLALPEGWVAFVDQLYAGEAIQIRDEKRRFICRLYHSPKGWERSFCYDKFFTTPQEAFDQC